MSGEVFEYKSDTRAVSSGTEYVLDTSDANGIPCVWSGYVVSAQANFSWKFDWNELAEQAIESLTGHIIVKDVCNSFNPHQIQVDISETNNTVQTNIRTYDRCNAFFEYALVPTYVQYEISYDPMFIPSVFNDAILIVDGRKLHVNKTFLSIHSEFFHGLFSSNFKEAELDEIPIEDVSYEDIGLLFSSFYPNPIFPEDRTVEKLLEMARRFLVPSVTGIVEYHLMHNSRIGNEKMMWLADEYGLEKRLEKSIRQMNTLEKAKNLQKSPEFEKLSDKTRSKLLTRLMKLI